MDRLLANQFTDLNLQNKLGDTALLAASIKNHPEIAKSLVEKGANLQIPNNSGDTPISIATDPQGRVGIFCHVLPCCSQRKIVLEI